MNISTLHNLSVLWWEILISLRCSTKGKQQSEANTVAYVFSSNQTSNNSKQSNIGVVVDSSSHLLDWFYPSLTYLIPNLTFLTYPILQILGQRVVDIDPVYIMIM